MLERGKEFWNEHKKDILIGTGLALMSIGFITLVVGWYAFDSHLCSYVQFRSPGISVPVNSIACNHLVFRFYADLSSGPHLEALQNGHKFFSFR